MINGVDLRVSRQTLMSLFMATSIMSMGCSANPEQEAAAAMIWPPTDGAVVHVRFAAPPGETELCPEQVVEFSVDLNKGSGSGKNKYIYWRAQQWNTTSNTWEDLNTEYEVYFDPFKKSDAKPVGSDDGLLKSPKLDEDSPTGVFYKYTVIRNTDVCKGNPLDPFVRVF